MASISELPVAKRPNFLLLGAHPAIDFANTLVPPPGPDIEFLQSWQDVIDWMKETKLSDGKNLEVSESDAPQALERVRNLRHAWRTAAPAYSQAAWNSGQMQSVTRALERILRQNEPFPALVMDRYWNVLMTNESTAQEAFTLPPITRRKGRNRTVVLAHPFFWRLPVVRPPGFF